MVIGRLGREGLRNGGRRAWSDTTGDHKRYGNDDARNFQPVDGRDHFHDQGRRRDGGARGGTDWADVGIQRARIQVHTAMQLTRKEDASEEERHEEKLL